MTKIMLSWCLFIFAVNIFSNNFSIEAQIEVSELLRSPYCLDFIGGVLIAKIIAKGVVYGRRFLLIACIIALMGSRFFLEYEYVNNIGQFWIIIIPLIVVYCVVALEVADCKHLSVFLEKTGDASYSIYLSHSIVINAIGWIWASAFDGKLHILWLVSMIISSIIAGHASYQFVEIRTINYLKSFKLLSS